MNFETSADHNSFIDELHVAEQLNITTLIQLMSRLIMTNESITCVIINHALTIPCDKRFFCIYLITKSNGKT